MNLKLNKEVAQSLTNLRASPDFNRVLEWLKENRSKFLDECSTAEDNALYRAQGKVFVVNGLVDAYEAAPETTEKFKTQQR